MDVMDKVFLIFFIVAVLSIAGGMWYGDGQSSRRGK